MGAIVRLKSKNKIDNMYARKYYLYLFISICLFAGGVYCWREYSKFISFFYFLGSVFMFFLKNSYADYSKKSNCIHPNNLEDFMHSINIDKKSKTVEVIKDTFEYLLPLGIAIFILGIILIPIISHIYAYSHGLSSPSFSVIANNLAPAIITSVIFVLGSLESGFLKYRSSENSASHQSVNPEMLLKIENVKFPVEGQKEEFARKVSAYLVANNGIDRKDLFSICSDFLVKTNKEYSLSFLDKLIKKTEG